MHRHSYSNTAHPHSGAVLERYYYSSHIWRLSHSCIATAATPSLKNCPSAHLSCDYESVHASHIQNTVGLRRREPNELRALVSCRNWPWVSNRQSVDEPAANTQKTIVRLIKRLRLKVLEIRQLSIQSISLCTQNMMQTDRESAIGVVSSSSKTSRSSPFFCSVITAKSVGRNDLSNVAASSISQLHQL